MQGHVGVDSRLVRRPWDLTVLGSLTVLGGMAVLHFCLPFLKEIQEETEKGSVS